MMIAFYRDTEGKKTHRKGKEIKKIESDISLSNPVCDDIIFLLVFPLLQ